MRRRSRRSCELFREHVQPRPTRMFSTRFRSSSAAANPQSLPWAPARVVSFESGTGVRRCEEIVEHLFTTEALRRRDPKRKGIFFMSQCLSGGVGIFSHFLPPVRGHGQDGRGTANDTTPVFDVCLTPTPKSVILLQTFLDGHRPLIGRSYLAGYNIPSMAAIEGHFP